MANIKKLKAPFNILLRVEAETVGQLDCLALKNNTSRNAIIIQAIDLILKTKYHARD